MTPDVLYIDNCLVMKKGPSKLHDSDRLADWAAGTQGETQWQPENA
jgi:hypothetical protein